MTTLEMEAPPGLDGVVVAETAIGDVRGDEGFFHYRGHDATLLARNHTLEDVWHLLLFGHLPDANERERFAERVAAARARLPADVVAGLPAMRALGGGHDRMAALRTGWSLAAAAFGCRPWIDLTGQERVDQAVWLSAAGPLLAAGAHRDGVAEDLAAAPAGTAAAYLQLVTGRPAPPASVRALERYLVLTLDHGMNASTFAARTVASTGADLGAAVVAGLCALSGPLHGGAPSRALEMLDAIGTEDRAEAWVRTAIARGERIMGFGHRIYRTEDPRAMLLRETARELGGPRIDLAMHVEQVVLAVLRELKPGRVLDVNVEYHAALVLEAVGLPPVMFTPTFAVSRAIGWTVHAIEQMADSRIIRPSSRYVGPDPAGAR